MSNQSAAQAKRDAIAAQESALRSALADFETALDDVATALDTIAGLAAERVSKTTEIIETRFVRNAEAGCNSLATLADIAQLRSGALREALVRAIVSSGLGVRGIPLGDFVTVRAPSTGSAVASVDDAFTSVNAHLLAALDAHIARITD